VTENGPEIVVLPTAEAVTASAAERTAATLAESIAARGVAHWVTTGGSAAPGIYRRLGADPLRASVEWPRVHVWWGDDRYVPPDHPDSNVFPFEEILMGPRMTEAGSGSITFAGPSRSDFGVPLPVANLHPVPTAEAIGHARGAAWAAARYAEDLAELGPARDADGWPMFDLVILGVGPDGHVLSVFPGSPAWDETALAIAIPAPTHVSPHLERVTLHPRIVTAARSVLVVSTGSSKADALAAALAGGDVRPVPAGVARRPGATWLLDTAAAARLPAVTAGGPLPAAG
jgi:6-phosphogluconolactonase